MAGYWPNSNLTPFFNQAAPAANQFGFQHLSAVQNANEAQMNTARALLAASIPAATSTFLPNSSNFSSNQGPVLKTASKITLPPSLANKRKKKQSENIVPIPTEKALPATVSSIQSQLPSFDVLSTTSNEQEAESVPPVFSTDIGMGKEVVNPKPLKTDTESILLQQSNTHNKLFPHGAYRILHDNEHWHKFIITGPVAQNKERILKRILESCDPMLLLPIMYQEEGDTAVFYARNCGSAIERLCKNNQLVFELDNQKFILRILLQCAPVNKLKLNALVVLRRILDKRYNTSDRCLDLSNFEHDSELTDTMFCPLSQPTLLHYVLSTAVNFPINFSILRLCHNGIRQLKIEVLTKASYLKTLDLSHNELLYQGDLKDLKALTQVSNLILDGNPLCAEFRNPEEYISKMKSLLPRLTSLDGIPLYKGSINVPKEKNFLCSKAGHQMVDQFLKHFFDRYDWKDRRCLDGLYHNNALFSLTCIHLSGQSTSEGSSLTWYTAHNHNLTKVTDYSKADKNLYHGPDEILELFSSLPATEHDPYSFVVDLIHYNVKGAVISVCGVFRENISSPPDPDQMRSFKRVFVLVSTAPNEWQIINEQLHISNLTTEQVDSAFKLRRPPIEAPVAAWLIQDAQLLSEDEKDQMAGIMMQLTTLNKEWATKFLRDSHWYVREALIAFVNKFEAKELPREAFNRQ